MPRLRANTQPGSQGLREQRDRRGPVSGAMARWKPALTFRRRLLRQRVERDARPRSRKAKARQATERTQIATMTAKVQAPPTAVA